jgi:hypothetical protein
MIRKSIPEQEVKSDAPGDDHAETGPAGYVKTRLFQGLLLHRSTVPSNHHGSRRLLGMPPGIIEEREKKITNLFGKTAPRLQTGSRFRMRSGKDPARVQEVGCFCVPLLGRS